MQKFLFIIPLLLCSAAYSEAQVAQVLLNFDITDGNPVQTGEAVIGLSSSDVWNNIKSSSPVSDVVNSAGIATGVSFSSASSFKTFEAASGGGNTTYDSATANLMQGYAYNSAAYTGTTTTSLTLSGLSSYSGDAFTLVVYAAGNTVGSGSKLSLTSGATGGNSADVLGTTATNREISGGIGDAYQTFTGTITGANLTISAVPDLSSFSIVNGFQLEISPVIDVPEPSAWALMLSGFISLLVLSRRGFRTTRV